jgi:hypothetical protein
LVLVAQATCATSIKSASFRSISIIANRVALAQAIEI